MSRRGSAFKSIFLGRLIFEFYSFAKKGAHSEQNDDDQDEDDDDIRLHERPCNLG